MKNIFSYTRDYILLIVGALIYTLGLEMFLIPNGIIDGGVVGIALMAQEITAVPFSIWIVVLNLPFFYLGYKHIGKSFTIASLFSVICLAIWSSFLHGYSPVTNDTFLSTIFGGIILGIGVGLIIRYGGSLDGTEIVAIMGDKKSSFSVGEIIMFLNFFILGASGFVFSWNSAMYSLVAYFIAYKMIDVVTTGLDESKGIIVITNKYDEVGDAILYRLGRSVTFLYGEGAYLKEQKKILYCVVSRLEITKLKGVVHTVDPNAFISIIDVKEALGGTFGKKSIH